MVYAWIFYSGGVCVNHFSRDIEKPDFVEFANFHDVKTLHHEVTNEWFNNWLTKLVTTLTIGSYELVSGASGTSQGGWQFILEQGRIPVKKSIALNLKELVYGITYMWNLKYYINEHIYIYKTDSQTKRTDMFSLPKQEEMEEGRIGSLGLTDANYYINI